MLDGTAVGDVVGSVEGISVGPLAGTLDDNFVEVLFGVNVSIFVGV